MRNFMYVSVPTEGYAEVKKVGGNYIVHLEGKESVDGMTECYESVVNEEPDMATLAEELAVWKAHVGETKLKMAKSAKINEINKYDNSTAVNNFVIKMNGEKVTDYWIPRDLRSSLEGDVLAGSAVSDTYLFDIREMGISVELSCNKFLEALSALRRYAFGCYNVTSRHIASVNALTSVEEVEAYDFTTGYPEQLVFDVSELMP